MLDNCGGSSTHSSPLTRQALGTKSSSQTQLLLTRKEVVCLYYPVCRCQRTSATGRSAKKEGVNGGEGSQTNRRTGHLNHSLRTFTPPSSHLLPAAGLEFWASGVILQLPVEKLYGLKCSSSSSVASGTPAGVQPFSGRTFPGVFASLDPRLLSCSPPGWHYRPLAVRFRPPNPQRRLKKHPLGWWA